MIGAIVTCASMKMIPYWCRSCISGWHLQVNWCLCDTLNFTVYWIVWGRSAIKHVIGRCVICCRFEGQHYSAPPLLPLPALRVTEEPAFTYTGLDYAGPIYNFIKSDDNMEKVWIFLYMCCVKLDIVFNLSVQLFLRSLTRFTARRGVTLKITAQKKRSILTSVH